MRITQTNSSGDSTTSSGSTSRRSVTRTLRYSLTREPKVHIQFHTPAHAEDPKCPAGHVMEFEKLPYTGVCAQCKAKVCFGELAARCADCFVDLCSACCPQAGSPESSSSSPPGEGRTAGRAQRSSLQVDGRRVLKYPLQIEGRSSLAVQPPAHAQDAGHPDVDTSPPASRDRRTLRYNALREHKSSMSPSSGDSAESDPQQSVAPARKSSVLRERRSLAYAEESEAGQGRPAFTPRRRSRRHVLGAVREDGQLCEPIKIQLFTPGCEEESPERLPEPMCQIRER